MIKMMRAMMRTIMRTVVRTMIRTVVRTMMKAVVKTMMRTQVKTYGKVLLIAGDVGDSKTDCSQHLGTRMGKMAGWHFPSMKKALGAV